MEIIETSNKDPNETIEKVIKFLEGEKFDSIGIASFGPLDINPGIT
jgi:hypothetical protein